MRYAKWGRLSALLVTLGAAALLAGGALAQGVGRIDGEVRDLEGKPFPGVVVVGTHEETGQVREAKTDRNGLFSLGGLRPGMWALDFKIQDQVQYRERVRLGLGQEQRIYVNFKEIYAQQTAAQGEAARKAEEETKRFQSLKQHFDAGRAALDRAKGIRGLPAEQRQARAEEMAALLNTAVSEFQNARSAAGEKDPNLHLVLANLAEAYDTAGRYAEAAATYQAAIDLKPDQSSYYVNMSTAAARAGEIDAATAACEKVSSMEPANAATCWRNLGIIYFNNNRQKDAIQPLRKAIELDPRNPDQYYLLGASLVNVMDFKEEAGRMIPILQPGTVEAYQKYLELAPNGRFAADARAGLEMLEQLGVGIQTKVRAKKRG